MDETGLSTVPIKLPKILTIKGKNLVGRVFSEEHGQLVTAVCSIFPYDPKQFGGEDFSPSLVTDTCLEEFTNNVLEATSVEEPPQPGYVSVQVLYAEVDFAPLQIAPPSPGCISIDVLDLDIVFKDGAVMFLKKVEEKNNKATINLSEIISLPDRKQKQNRRKTES
ncbi:hypothetical protein ILUMI_24311 [Ignelater luminosus]|uniref:Uncharacterized protein n=1 Tax=Ignelater luminosus TaxID=2038154 RepID=A0A8K0CAR0_IGNLU|nr:hypothetical protein ILUMI_24311 [Ignelater luminosus]